MCGLVQYVFINVVIVHIRLFKVKGASNNVNVVSGLAIYVYENTCKLHVNEMYNCVSHPFDAEVHTKVLWSSYFKICLLIHLLTVPTVITFLVLFDLVTPQTSQKQAPCFFTDLSDKYSFPDTCIIWI